MENNVEFMEFIGSTVKKENEITENAISAALTALNPTIRQFNEPKYFVIDTIHDDGDLTSRYPD